MENQEQYIFSEEIAKVKDNNCNIYHNAKVINCYLKNNVIIGEDSYVTDSLFGEYVQINRRNFLIDVKINDFTYTGMNTTIKHTDIGKYSSISWNVSIGGANHDYQCISTSPFHQLKSFGFTRENDEINFDRITIGNDVWIGMNSCILPSKNLTIGNGAVIGAGSVVTKSVPDYAIVVGNPARILKYRFEKNIIDYLNAIQWWELPKNIIKDNIYMFKNKLSIKDCEKLYKLKMECNL